MAVYYTWQNPIKERKFYWTTPQHVKQVNHLCEVPPTCQLSHPGSLTLGIPRHFAHPHHSKGGTSNRTEFFLMDVLHIIHGYFCTRTI